MIPEFLAETDEYWVINKPAALATEPPSNSPTLRDWLIDEAKIKAGEWDEESRYGIVHRLDTDTSGVIIWAKTPTAQESLRRLWQGRQVKKTYLALVEGRTELSGTIELAIERDNRNDRQKVALLPSPKSRPAITEYKTLAHGRVGEREVSLIEAHPITGRTHQIRVHFKAIGHPLIGDELYGEKLTNQIAESVGLKRHFLHASELCLPEGDCYSASLPSDLQDALTSAKIDYSS